MGLEPKVLKPLHLYEHQAGGVAGDEEGAEHVEARALQQLPDGFQVRVLRRGRRGPPRPHRRGLRLEGVPPCARRRQHLRHAQALGVRQALGRGLKNLEFEV